MTSGKPFVNDKTHRLPPPRCLLDMLCAIHQAPTTHHLDVSVMLPREGSGPAHMAGCHFLMPGSVLRVRSSSLLSLLTTLGGRDSYTIAQIGNQRLGEATELPKIPQLTSCSIRV